MATIPIDGLVTEQQIKLEICQLLERFPDRILFTVTPPKRTKYSSKFMKVGWPDIYGMIVQSREYGLSRPPMPFFIEVKKPDGTLSLAQHQLLEQAKRMGAITCVATCVEDVRKVLGI